MAKTVNSGPSRSTPPSHGTAILGVSDHGGWAIFITASCNGTLLDRRRVSLVDDDLPKIPQHSECQRLPIDKAVALVERVRASAGRHAVLALEDVARSVPHITGIALRKCPPLPPTIAECIQDYRAQNVADWVMYRKALATAAQARNWTVHWYDAKTVPQIAGMALGVPSLDTYFAEVRKTIGPPWTMDHKLALAAAIAAAQA